MHFIQHFNQTFSWDKFDYHRIVLSSNKIDRGEAKRKEIDQIITMQVGFDLCWQRLEG